MIERLTQWLQRRATRRKFVAMAREGAPLVFAAEEFDVRRQPDFEKLSGELSLPIEYNRMLMRAHPDAIGWWQGRLVLGLIGQHGEIWYRLLHESEL